MNKDDLTICAFRHCLDKGGYIAGDMVNHLRKNWHDISEPYQEIVKNDIREAIHARSYSGHYDGDPWGCLLRAVEDIENYKRSEK